MDLNAYTEGHIESFLLNYKLLLQDLAEVAAEWATLDRETQSDQSMLFMQSWGNRKVLGALYAGKRLTIKQERLLADLDRHLLKQAPLLQQCYGLDFAQLLTIFRWGTPLADSTDSVQIVVAPATLNRMATSLAPVVT